MYETEVLIIAALSAVSVLKIMTGSFIDMIDILRLNRYLLRMWDLK